ncbi:MAG: rRNA maturation RNase YbeY [Betaproteobacteria bacterium]|nr:rRNA maturation RNase YbeY [Betaproteobacteria bacterium]
MSARKTPSDPISASRARPRPAAERLLPANEAFHIDLQVATRSRGVPPQSKFRLWARAVPVRRAEVTLRLVGMPEGRRLNRLYRGRDYATNVLSFRYERGTGIAVGDLLLCAPVIAREAREQGKPSAAHYAHLTIHGMLHLLGYNHERAPQAERMERLEKRILHSLGFADPYGEHP